MLDKLKENLPGPLKKMLGGDTANSESDEHSEESDEDSHDSETNERAAPSEDPKKKQMSMIIRVIVVLALGYLALDQFVLNNDKQEEQMPTVAVKPRKNRKKPKDQKAVVAGDEKIADAGAVNAKPEVKEEPKAEPKAEPQEEPKEEKTPPVENINIASKNTTTETKPDFEMPEEKPEQKTEEKPAVEKTEAPVEKTAEKKTEKPVDDAPVVNVGEVKTKESDDKLDKMIDGLESTAKSDDKKSKLEDKIVEEEVYTPPPAYDKIGRGLVYNCTDKYWACIERTAYIACNKNMKFNKSQGKTPECVIQNVYNSDDDCGVVQKYNVSTNKATDFCKP